MAARKRRAGARRNEEAPLSLHFVYRLRPGLTERQARTLEGFFAAAIEDAAEVYRARHGESPLDVGGSVLSAEVGVSTLH